MVLNQSSGKEGGHWEEVQRKPFQCLDHITQDYSYIYCKNLLKCMFKSSRLSILGMLYPKWNESREREAEGEREKETEKENALNCCFQFWFHHQLLLGFGAAIFVVYQFPQWQNSCIGLNFLIHIPIVNFLFTISEKQKCVHNLFSSKTELNQYWDILCFYQYHYRFCYRNSSVFDYGKLSRSYCDVWCIFSILTF